MLYQNIKCSADNPLTIETLHIEEYPWHQHEEGTLEIIYVLKGSIKLDISLETLVLQEDSVFVVNSETLHYISDCSDDNRVAVFHINMHTFSDLFPDISDYIFVLNSTDESDVPEMVLFVKETLLAIAVQYYKLERSPRKTIRELMISLLLCLVNHFQLWHVEDQLIKPSNLHKNKPSHVSRIRRVVAYMYEHYNEKITLDDLAAREYVSKYYISHLFTAVIGKPFQETMTYVRCDESQKWVYGTDKSIEDVAAECGFSSAAFFRKSYSEKKGRTPLKDRKFFKDKTINVMSPLVTVIDDIDIISDLLITPSDYQYSQPRLPRESGEMILLDFTDTSSSEFFPNRSCIYLDDILSGLTPNYLQNLEAVCEKIGFTKLLIDSESIFEKYKVLKTFGFMQNLINCIADHKLQLYLTEPSPEFKSSEKEFSSYCRDLCGIDVICSYALPPIDTAPNAVDRLEKILSAKPALNCVSLFDIINEKGLKRSLYACYELLSKMTGSLLFSGKGYIVTAAGNSYRILLYNAPGSGFGSFAKDFFIKLTNINKAYLLKTLHFNSYATSEADVWRNIGAPSVISPDTMEYIKNDASFHSKIISLRPCVEHDMFHSLNPGHIVLITLEKLQ